tara:strand:- start:18210 stop:18425 length:216 start_codon:yes stop_codon:yes gene_type:complete
MLIDKRIEGFKRGADLESEWIEGYATGFSGIGPCIIICPDIGTLSREVQRKFGTKLDTSGVFKVKVRSCDE